MQVGKFMKIYVKKTVSAVLVLLVLLSMAACGQETEPSADSAEPVVIESAQPLDTRPAGEPIRVAPVVEETRTGYEQGDLVVAPGGNDANQGTPEQPLATVAAAKKMIQSDAGDERRIIWLREGVYELEGTLSFTSEDRANVTYKAYNGEDAVISAGRAISGWSVEQVNGVQVWTAPVDEAFSSLYKAGARLTLARYPDEGEEMLKVTSVNGNDYSRPGYAAFHLDANILSADGITDADLTGAKVRTYHFWAEENHTITGYNSENGRVAIDTATSYDVYKDDPCYVENFKNALSAPGEWYLDEAAMKVYYVPSESDNIETTVLYYSRLNTAMDISGAEGLTFENIQFSYSGYDPKLCEYSYQAAIQVPGAIEIKDSKNVAFRGCTFFGIGHSGIALRTNVSHVEVSGSMFQDLGGSGVSVMGYVYKIMQPLTEIIAPQTPDNILIKDNLITEYGRIFNSATGVQVAAGTNVEISNNEIRNGEYSGVSVGWVWGFGYQATSNITISKNIIHDIGGLLGDMGGVYTLGPLENSFISGNIIYNISCGENTYGGWGIYNDEGTSGVTSEYNIVFDCSDQCYHQHYGRENLVRNNIFLSYEGYPLEIDPDHPDAEHVSLFIENNLLAINSSADTEGDIPRSKLFVTTDIPYEGYNISVNNNIYWDMGSHPRGETIMTLIEHNSPMYVNGTYADPEFSENLPESEAEIPNCMPAENSEIYATGFVAWDYSDAGTLGTVQPIY